MFPKNATKIFGMYMDKCCETCYTDSKVVSSVVPRKGELYIFEDTLKENMSLSVYNAGYQKCQPGHCTGRGKRGFYLVHYVVAGKGVFYINDREYHLSAGDMFFIFPNDIVSYKADIDDPWDYYWVAFNGTEARRMLGHTGFSSECPVLHLENTDELREYLLNIYRASGNTPAADAAMTGHLHIFLSELMRITYTARERVGTQDYLAQALEYIHDHYTQPLRVDEIASHVGVSRSQLYRAFVQKYGVSPHTYLKNYRISEACSLLRRPEFTVGEAAAEVGFTDPLYFSRVFREVKGMAPSVYQHKHSV